MMAQYDDELRNHLTPLLQHNIVQISDIVDELILEIESNYSVSFSGIDWTIHKYIDMAIFSENLIEKQLTINQFLMRIKKKYPNLLDEKVNVFGDSLTKEAIAYFKNNNPSIYYSANLNINLDGSIYVCAENKDEEIILRCPQKWINEKTSELKIEEVKKFIKETKIKIFQKGYLNYSDCYFYAKKNIFENAILKKILQKRFNYVFIDEMQDLERFQIKIIDDIFFSESSKTIIQRIGDINQSIYSSGKKIKVECDWKPRTIEYLKSSYRLTEEIANL